MPTVEPFPVERAHRIAATAEGARWLIDGLWGFDAVGILGGEPKCCKSLLALTMAVAVASGAPCLGSMQPRRTGPVLLFAAEDSALMVRDRLSSLAVGLGQELSQLPIHVITVPTIRLDSDADRNRLAMTVHVHQPALLILDPFVRLHRIDENIAGEVAPILDSLRQLQRREGCAVMVVHHARKGGAHLRAGQALRGSSEFHAWGDSNLFLRRQRDTLTLDIEHRAAAAPDPIRLQLQATATELVLEPDSAAEAAGDQGGDQGPERRLLDALSAAGAPLARRDLQAAVRIRSSQVGVLLHHLERQGRIVRDASGYRLADAPAAVVC
jgi:RecA-family ATPase